MSPEYHQILGLVRACCHSKAVIDNASRLSSANLLEQGATMPLATFYGNLIGFFESYRDLPDANQLYQVYVSTHAQMPQFVPMGSIAAQDEVTAVYQFVSENLSIPNTQPYVDLVNRLYKNTVGMKQLETMFEQAKQTGDYSVLANQTNRLATQVSERREVHKVLSKKNAKPAVRMPTGIEWLDTLTCGGLPRGNSIGVLAPTGGGKTTFSSQVASGLAIQGYKVGLVFTEQTFQEAELIDKFWSLATGRPTEDFAPFDDEDDFPPELVTETDKKVVHAMNDNIMGIDFAAKPGTFEEIEAICSGELCAEGESPPDVIILDWAGEFAKTLQESGGANTDGETLALRTTADRCAQIARKFDICVIVLHQLSPACSNPMGYYDHTNGNNCRQFAFNLSYCMVINPRDTNDVTVARMTKGRWNARSERVLLLNGPHSRFDGLNGYRAGRGKWEREGEGHVMPGAKKAEEPDYGISKASWLQESTSDA